MNVSRPSLLKSSCAVLAVVLAMCAVALGHNEEDLVHQRHSADLDGDGYPDLVTAVFYKTDTNGYGFERAVLQINSSILVVRGTAMAPTLHIVDIDSTDVYREVAIFERGPSDDYATHLFRFGNGVIANIGTVPGRTTGPPQVNGSGRICTKCRGHVLETWWYPCEFKFSRYSSQLEEGLQRWKPMDAHVTLKADLPLVASPRYYEPAGILRVGDRATVLKTDNADWCYIESEDGVAGWFGLVGGRRIASNGLTLSEVFDGLRIAD